MKLYCLILAVSLSTNVVAQKNFDRATFDALINRYAQDPVKFLKTETAPNFVLTTADGAFWDTERTIGLYDRNTQTGRNYEHVVVRQYGSTGVATGILTHSYTSKSDGKPSTLREAFTYVFNSPKASTWQLVSAQHSWAPAGTLAENEAAIKQVIEDATAAVYALDSKKYQNTWAQKSYDSRVGSDFGNVVTRRSGEEFRKFITEAVAKATEPGKDKVTRDNWLIRINGNSAFVVFDQHNTRPDGSTRNSVEERYLERINNAWKLVNVTVLVAK